ncbi:MAG: zinc ABC transporter substrate-binding protein [Bacilli bacterium]|jgi:zinc transport system substrate-binding protein|nr:zinc ABC transporter substrate-binding protein [Bacilli bacterium]MCX4253800.1 metal ABC transporter substrate-binding protein [Bacilli bacterium]
MKKMLKVLGLFSFIFFLSGCLNDDKLSNDNVYTSIYPIQYLTEYLYGEQKTVASIYPNGADVSKYELTNKQKETYHKGALFVYNGLTNEKELAREFLNDNKNILLIDVSYGLSYEDSIEELWLSPNNYLMLAKNIKNNLIEYTTSKTVIDTIENKYKELEEELSYMDADLRNIANSANFDGNSILVVSSNKLKFLENYGFEVIVLNSDNINPTSVKSNFKNEKYKDIYLCNTDEKSELITELEKDYKANIINVNVMQTLTDGDVASNENYLTIMQNFIDKIRNTALS